VSDLLNEDRVSVYMDNVVNLFETSSQIVAASQFSKRFSFLTVVPSLYAMTMFNKGLDFSAENCHVESIFQEKAWLPKVRLRDWSVTVPAVDDRHIWRDQVVKNIFAGNLSRVWHSISRATEISPAVLWENTAIYVYWLYEKRIGEEANDSQKLRIHEDFQYLLTAPAALFGQSENPLSKYYSSKCKVSTSDQPVRVRQTCCYYYQTTTNQTYCSTCPRKQ